MQQQRMRIRLVFMVERVWWLDVNIIKWGLSRLFYPIFRRVADGRSGVPLWYKLVVSPQVDIHFNIAINCRSRDWITSGWFTVSRGNGVLPWRVDDQAFT